MYQQYKDVAEFYIVYISEAHAADDRSPVGYAKDLGIKEHTNYGERCAVATRLQKEKRLTIPCLIDGMDNKVANAYQGWPDRVYLVRKDGRLAVAGKRGPWGFRPAINRANKWLAEYYQTSVEPELVIPDEDEPGIGELQGDLYRAFRNSDYKQALAIAEKLHGLDPEDVGTVYNIACIHAVMGDKGSAYSWLEKAVETGYSDANHLVQDEDFKAIRDEARFKELVKRVQAKAGQGASTVADPAAYASILGDWEMRTTMGERAIEATMSLVIKDDKLVATWASQGRTMAMTDLKLVGDRFSFKRTMGPGMDLHFEGTVKSDRISGEYDGPFGTLKSVGERRTPH